MYLIKYDLQQERDFSSYISNEQLKSATTLAQFDFSLVIYYTTCSEHILIGMLGTSGWQDHDVLLYTIPYCVHLAFFSTSTWYTEKIYLVIHQKHGKPWNHFFAVVQRLDVTFTSSTEERNVASSRKKCTNQGENLR